MTFLPVAAAAPSRPATRRRARRRPDIPFNWRLALALTANVAAWAAIIRVAMAAL